MGDDRKQKALLLNIENCPPAVKDQVEAINTALTFLQQRNGKTHFHSKGNQLAQRVTQLGKECLAYLRIDKDGIVGERPQATLDALAKVMNDVCALKACELLVWKLQALDAILKQQNKEEKQQNQTIVAKLKGQATTLSQEIQALAENNNIQLQMQENGKFSPIPTQIHALKPKIQRINTEKLPQSLQTLYAVSGSKTKNKIGSIAMLAGAVIGAVVGICLGLVLPAGLPGIAFGGIVGCLVGASLGASTSEIGWKVGEFAEQRRFFGVKKGDFSLASLSRDVGDIVDTLGTPRALADSGAEEWWMATATSPF